MSNGSSTGTPVRAISDTFRVATVILWTCAAAASNESITGNGSGTLNRPRLGDVGGDREAVDVRLRTLGPSSTTGPRGGVHRGAVEDPLRGVPLLAGRIEVVPQPLVDHLMVGVQPRPALRRSLLFLPPRRFERRDNGPVADAVLACSARSTTRLTQHGVLPHNSTRDRSVDMSTACAASAATGSPPVALTGWSALSIGP